MQRRLTVASTDVFLCFVMPRSVPRNTVVAAFLGVSSRRYAILRRETSILIIAAGVAESRSDKMALFVRPADGETPGAVS